MLVGVPASCRAGHGPTVVVVVVGVPPVPNSSRRPAGSRALRVAAAMAYGPPGPPPGREDLAPLFDIRIAAESAGLVDYAVDSRGSTSRTSPPDDTTRTTWPECSSPCRARTWQRCPHTVATPWLPFAPRTTVSHPVITWDEAKGSRRRRRHERRAATKMSPDKLADTGMTTAGCAPDHSLCRNNPAKVKATNPPTACRP